jgi:hypothetical protein
LPLSKFPSFFCLLTQLLQFYGTRLAARAFGHVDVHVHCNDAMQHKDVLILPWITGYFPAVTRSRQRRHSADYATSVSSSAKVSSSSSCDAILPNITQACQAFLDIPIAYAIPDIRYDLRRMALSMLFNTNITGGGGGGGDGRLASIVSSICPNIYEAAREYHATYLWSSSTNINSSTTPPLEPPPHHGTMDVPFIMPPLPPLAAATATTSGGSDPVNDDNIIVHPRRQATTAIAPAVAVLQFDDVVIHFRCGDLMSLGHPDYCFVPFASFARHIPPQVRSIGIVTQPFTKTKPGVGWSRGVDVKSSTGLQRCRVVVQDYQAYLQRAFPNATVTIHNSGESESMTLAYTRMIMANQTFCMASTFPIFAALATFGHAYIHVPRYENAPSRFLLSPEPSQVVHHHNNVVENNDNIHLLRNEPYIMADDLIKMWKRPGQGQDAVLEWFRQEPNASLTTTTTSTRMKIGNVLVRVLKKQHPTPIESS